MRTITFSWFQVLFIIFALLFFSGCPPDRPEQYPVSSLIMTAYRHQINFDSLQTSIAKDSLLEVISVDGGILMYGELRGAVDYYLWINDSLVVVKINAFYVYRGDMPNSKYGKVRYEYRQRKNRENFYKDLPEYISSSVFLNENPIANQRRLIDIREVPLQMLRDKMVPIDTLNWRSSVFENEGYYQFQEGVLEAAFTIRDTTRQLHIKGFYDKGLETGDWQYFDLADNLQWTEIYEKGELQDVKYNSSSYLKREKRLPTVKETILAHRIFFFIFLIAGICLLVFYFKNLKTISFPHRNMNLWSILGWTLASPFVSIATVIFYLIFLLITSGLLQLIFSWDVPYHRTLFPFTICILYFPFGVLYFIATFRYKDIIWHAGILCIGLLAFEEYMFLKSIEVGIL